MASTKILTAATKGTSSTAQVLAGNSCAVRCDSGSLDVVIEGIVFASMDPKQAEVFTLAAGDSLVLTATGDNTTAWYGDIS